MRSPAIPFILARRSAPPRLEEPLYEALRPALTGLADLHLTPGSGQDFFGSNIDFKDCSVSSGVHPGFRGRSAATHDDQNLTLLLCYMGSAELRYGTGQRLRLQPMQAGLVKSHDWTAACTDYGGVALRLPKQRLAHGISLALDREVSVEALDEAELGREAAFCLQRTLQAMQIAYRRDTAASGLFDEQLLSAVALCVPDWQAGAGADPRQRFRHVVDRACRLVRRDLRSPQSVADLCQRLNVSERYLQIAFQAVAGTSPKQWILAERLAAARQAMLGDPALPLARIAEDFSFSSPAHFSKAFRKVFGESPQTTRRSGS